MAKIANCFNCVYSYCDHEHALWSMSMGRLTWPACANQPEAPGRMQRVPQRGICRNYRPRPATPESDVKQIPLGGESYAYVDAADFDWLNQWTWHLRGGYAMRYSKGKPVYLHREIMQPPKGMVVDHKNRNKVDDTRANLWICTHRENACNKEKRADTSSRFRGVSRRKGTDWWYAAIRVNGILLFLGSFTDEVEAARAYDRAAAVYFGPCAALNFPDDWPSERRAQVYAQGEELRRKIFARRRPAGQRGRKATAGRKPRAAGRKKVATGGTRRSRTKRAAKNKKDPAQPSAATKEIVHHRSH